MSPDCGYTTINKYMLNAPICPSWPLGGGSAYSFNFFPWYAWWGPWTSTFVRQTIQAPVLSKCRTLFSLTEPVRTPARAAMLMPLSCARIVGAQITHLLTMSTPCNATTLVLVSPASGVAHHPVASTHISSLPYHHLEHWLLQYARQAHVKVQHLCLRSR